MPRSLSCAEGAGPAAATTTAGAAVGFPPDPRCHMLAVVLLAGYSLRAMNHVRRSFEPGLNGALILLDVLQAERGEQSQAARPGDAPRPNAARTLLAIAAAIDVPRETVRRSANALVDADWLRAARQGGYETTGRTRRCFAVEHDFVPYAEFVWTAQQLSQAMTTADDGIDALVAAHPWQSALATRREGVPHPAYLESMPALQDRLGGATRAARERAASVVDGYLYRHLKRLRATFEGDLLLPLILGEIAHRNIAMLTHRGDRAQQMRTLGSRFGSDATRLREVFMPTNAYSLSQSMGVPDATIRRKIAHLRMREWVSVDAGGNLVVETSTVREHSTLCNLEALNDMVAGYRTLVALGLAT